MKKRKKINVITKSEFNKRRRLYIKSLINNENFEDAEGHGVNRNKEFTKYFGATIN